MAGAEAKTLRTPSTSDERRYVPRNSLGEEWKPSARQREFLSLTCREALYAGEAGGGKTGALLLSALQNVEVPGYAALILRRTFPELKQPDGPMDQLRHWLSGTNARWNENEHTWWFSTSGAMSRIVFGYLDSSADVERYQGGGYQFFGFDELTHFRESDYTDLFARARKQTSMGGLPIIFRATANPGGRGHVWVKKRWSLRGTPSAAIETVTRTGDVRVFVPSKLEDNPGIDIPSYRANLSELGAVAHARMRYGDWDVVAGGKVFTAEALTYKALPSLPLTYGIGHDLAYSTSSDADYSTAVVMARAHVPANDTPEHDAWFVVDVMRERLSAPDVAKRLKALHQRYPTAARRFYSGGGAEKGIGDLYADLGVHVGSMPTGARSKLTRAQGVAAKWNGRPPDERDPADHGDPQRIYVPERAPWVEEFLNELRSFTGEDDADHDDQVDAFAAAFDVLQGSWSAEYESISRRVTADLGSLPGDERPNARGFSFG